MRKALAARHFSQSNHTQTKMTKRTPGVLQKFSADGAVTWINKNGAPIRSIRTRAMRSPKTELEAATQRFVDLYDFAPIAYMSFDRAGRIEEANLAATELLGVPRDLLIGRPFAFYVADLDSFLHHLLYCRTSQQQVATEIELKPKKGERIPAQLLSTPITSTTRNGALLYQTAIIDLSERKRHVQQLAEQARLLDLSNDAIIVRDKNERITYWNRGATQLYGYTQQEALGTVIQDLLKSKLPEPLPKITRSCFAIATGKAKSFKRDAMAAGLSCSRAGRWTAMSKESAGIFWKQTTILPAAKRRKPRCKRPKTYWNSAWASEHETYAQRTRC